MINPLFAFVLLAAPTAPNVVIPPAATVDEACDPAKLAVFMAAPPKQMITLVTDLDQRIQWALREERAGEARMSELRGREDAAGARARPLLTAAAIALAAALALGFVAARRRSQALAAGAWGVAAVAVALGWLAMDGRRGAEAEARTLLGRQFTVVGCRLRMVEARLQMQQSLYAKCTYDLDEAGEDIIGFESKLRNGTPVTIEELQKLHTEIRESQRPSP